MKPSADDYIRQIDYLRSLKIKDNDDNLIKYFDIQNGSSFEEVFNNFFTIFQYFFSKEKSKYNYSEPYLAFIDDEGINAFAGKTDDISIIGINADTIRELHQLFIGIDLGSILSGNLNKYRIMEEIGQEDFVNKLYYNCQMFIFFHEFGHIVQNIDGSSNFQNEMADNANYSEIQHLKEYDADQFAAIHMASLTGHWMEGLKGELREQYYNREVAEMLLAITCSSIFITYLIFQSGTKDFYTNKWSHPHPSIRAGYILNTIVDAFKKHNKAGFEIDHKVIFNDAFEITKRVVTDASVRGVIFQSEDDFNQFYEIWQNKRNEIQAYFDSLHELAQSTSGLAWSRLAS
ncbi:MAG: hypothetical protein IPI90_07085 [Saprospiraceae bacterium]|nr:hypothetical protein [Candidatus Vicinibacter affinis]